LQREGREEREKRKKEEDRQFVALPKTPFGRMRKEKST